MYNKHMDIHKKQEGEVCLPKARVDELLDIHSEDAATWRIFKIMSEFVSGFEFLRKYGKTATFFGSSKCALDDAIYKDATRLAGMLVEDGFDIITGGGPGIMEAANKGAFEAGGKSAGLNIELPGGQVLNTYVNDTLSFHYFFTRKVILSFASEVYVFFPGGFGTLDEFFEIVTLVKTKKIRKVPIILFGKNYWQPLLDFFKNTLYKGHLSIDESDMELYKLVDSVDEAFDYITTNITC